MELLWVRRHLGMLTAGVLYTKLQASGGVPFKVQAVCLPFVTVKGPTGRTRVIDLRQIQLVRLDPDFAKVTRTALKKGK